MKPEEIQIPSDRVLVAVDAYGSTPFCRVVEGDIGSMIRYPNRYRLAPRTLVAELELEEARHAEALAEFTRRAHDLPPITFDVQAR